MSQKGEQEVDLTVSSETTSRNADVSTNSLNAGVKSQFGDLNAGSQAMNTEKWEEVWEKGMTKFHLTYVHPMLKRFYDVLTGGKSGTKTIFLPMCGKTLDMNWLAEKGHRVVGAECVELACRQFYEDHNIEYTTEPIKPINGQVFKSKDSAKNVIIFCCDFYQLTKDMLGPLDAVWDRGSLAAINPSERKQYVQTIVKLLSPGTIYLVDSFLVDNSKFAGPPFNFPIDELKSLFESHATVEQIAERDAMTEWQRSWGVDYFYENVSSITFHG